MARLRAFTSGGGAGVPWWPGREMLLIMLAAAAVSCLGGMLSPLQEPMRIALKLSDDQMALLQGFAASLPAAATAIPFGLAIDRYSRSRLIFAFVAIAMLCNAWLALATGFVGLLLAQMAAGPFRHGSTMAAESLIGDLYPPTQRGRASMALSIAQSAGSAIAFVFAGQLLRELAGGPNAWREAALGSAALMVPALALLLAMREPPRTEVVHEDTSAKQSFWELWEYRGRVGTLLVGFVLGEVAINSVSVWTAPTLSREFALTPTQIGDIASALLFGGGLIGAVAGGAMADFCQRSGKARRTMWVMVVLSMIIAPAGMFGLAPNLPLATILLGTYITVRSGLLVMTLALFTIVIPNEIRGLSLAISGAANVFVGSGVAPLAVSVLSDALGGGRMIGVALAIVSGAASAVCALVFLCGMRTVPERL
jgi:MFS family permease